MERRLGILLLGACVFSALVLGQPQDQSGFISIDCGSSTEYIDAATGLKYVPDEDFIDSGLNSIISSEYITNGLQTQFKSVRSFPDGKRNCYTLKPNQVDDTQYFMRAQFMYGNYDSKNNSPEFDLYIGVNLWTTISIKGNDLPVTTEMIYVPTTNITNVCLVNKNLGTPFISVLELRMISKNIYASSLPGIHKLGERSNMATNSLNEIRFPDDQYDRIWKPKDSSDTTKNLTTISIINNQNSYLPPVNVLSTAITPKKTKNNLEFSWSANIEMDHYIYLHFAELENLTAKQFRQFDIYLNDTPFYLGFSPNFLSVVTIYTPSPFVGKWFNFSFRMSGNSTLPPILNAMEYYTFDPTPQNETHRADTESITKIKSTYDLKKLWQGDPCAPKDYSWDGLTCSFSGFGEPRITALNLSSSNLAGLISRNISGLKLLESLDLSNNSLNGSVPEFLATMASLKVLNLKGNNLTGTVPSLLVEKQLAGTLLLSVDENLCISRSCNTTTTNKSMPTPTNEKSKKTSSTILIVSSIAGSLLLIVILAGIIFCFLKKKQKKDETLNSEARAVNINDNTLETGNQQYTYSQILIMTNNFERRIGKGGLGTVYQGQLDGAQVAVKMLSPYSSSGYKEFKSEVQLLMRVCHRNLTSLVGYCDEGGKLGLIYEYMSNGNLETNLSSNNQQYLTWEDRMYIAVDAAKGLEFLHTCRIPPIVHRDIKSSNILLDDHFHAKVTDFGLSQVFATESGDMYHEQPLVAGKSEYLAPEYYTSQRLSKETDVFAFGVVLLEIVTSQPVFTSDKTHISKRVSQILSNTGNVEEIIDPRLQGNYEINSVWKTIEIAMACMLPVPDQRPTMVQVAEDLRQCLQMEMDSKKPVTAAETIDDNAIEMVSMDINSGLTPMGR